MSHIVEKNNLFTIHLDQTPENPRTTYDCITTIIYKKGSRYILGDTTDAEIPQGAVVRPVYAYIHSSVALSLTPFNCPWDSGQSGFIWAMPQEGVDIEQVMDCELKEFEAYLNGNVYGWVAEDGESCWGYYDLDHCRADAKEHVEGLQPFEVQITKTVFAHSRAEAEARV